MNEIAFIAGTILRLLESGSNLVLASIVDQKGSTPRANGAKMVIGADGRYYGTIGGSLLEATAINEARMVLASGQSKLLEFDLSNPDPTRPDMICGGKATILLDFIPPDGKTLEAFRIWFEAIKGSQNATLLTFILGNTDINTTHYMVFGNNLVTGDCPLSQREIEMVLAAVSKASRTIMVQLEGLTVVADPPQTVKTLFCFGAGHVAVPTAHIAAIVGFRVVVADDRFNFANIERFPDASEIRVIEDYNNTLYELELDKDSFIVIFTRGHMFDHIVLKQALRTQAGYIGMISSRRKRDTIFQTLLDEGFTPDDLMRVHSPIGIPIKAETPEEIAVSIVAELINERGKQQS